jgi:hypothetical protein
VSYDGALPFRVRLDGEPVASETSFAWAGAYSLTIATTLPHLAVELHSSYVGHPGVPTAASHLRLANGLRETVQTTLTNESVCLVFTPRGAAYDHAHHVLELLESLGFDGRLEISDDAFVALEAVLS